MSRYPTFREFNKKEFAELLKKGQGNRTQLQFSEDIGMSESYLSCYIGEKKETPPTPNTLLKISRASQNDVTFPALMDACGYILKRGMDLKSFAEIKEAAKKRNYVNKEVVYKNIISSALADKGYTWQGKPLPDDHHLAYQFDISIYNSAINEWHFIYLREDLYSRGHDIDSLPIYLLKYAPPNSKVSIVTHLKKYFDQAEKIKYPALLLYLSFILLDPDSLKVEKEITIPTACEDSDDIPKLI